MATYKFRMTVKPVDAREADVMSKWRESPENVLTQSSNIEHLRTDESRWQIDRQLSYIATAYDVNPCVEGNFTLPESFAKQLSIEHPALWFQVDSCLLSPLAEPTTRSCALVNGTEHTTHLTPEMVYASLPNAKLCNEIGTLYKQVATLSKDVDEYDVDGALYHLSEVKLRVKRTLLRED